MTLIKKWCITSYFGEPLLSKLRILLSSSSSLDPLQAGTDRVLVAAPLTYQLF